MTDRIAIDTEVLRQHAAAMRQVAAEVQEAAAAARGIDLAGGAFGIMCSFLVPPALLVSSAATNGIASGVGMLTRTAQEITEVAADVDQREQDHVAALNALQKPMD